MASPRVLIVARRTVRKNKFIDFVGEYHLDLIVSNGAAPVIVPRVSGIDSLLESFEPIDGILLCEGEDINPSLYSSSTTLSSTELDEIRLLHSSDAAVLDSNKDSIELRLTHLCLARSIPFLGICRGSQLLNVACGGTLHADVETELAKKGGSAEEAVRHINYDDYDCYRHRVRLVAGMPLYCWFDGKLEIEVNSYHHQGVKKLAERFVAMAFAEDGLIEGFYDPEVYDPEEGKFLIGLQFHPERMRKTGSDEFDYLGCPRIYQEFVKAVTAYHKKNVNKVTNSTDLNSKFEQKVNWKKRTLARRPSVAKNICIKGQAMRLSKASNLQPGAEILELNAGLSSQLGLRLFHTEATVKNSPTSLTRLMILKESEEEVRAIMEKKSVEQLYDLLFLYQRMGKLCSHVLERKLLLS